MLHPSGPRIPSNWRKVQPHGVEEKFTKFSGEPRDARRNLWYITSKNQNFYRNRCEIARGDAGQIWNFGSKIEIRIWNLVVDIKIPESTSKIHNRISKIRSPYSSRIWSRDLKIWIQRPRFGQSVKFQPNLNFSSNQNIDFVLGIMTSPSPFPVGIIVGFSILRKARGLMLSYGHFW